ncbi:hypothetical protein MMC13_004914 [Lambiella insularis]|nr:hypothetical protein [Lambiella insularis]
MSSSDVLGGKESSDFPKSISLKSHKVLPRRRVDLNHESAFWGSLNGHPKEVSAQAPKDESKALVSSTSPTQVDPAFRLPLTPPPVAREDAARSAVMRADSNTLPGLPHISSSLSTPINQRSPPTPEKTPPTMLAKGPELTLPPRIDQASSRTASFTTAREDFSSDDEGDTQTHFSHVTGMEKARKDHSDSEPSRKVGLGLGLESEDEDMTPTAQTPKDRSNGPDFTTFDGAWGHLTDTVKEDTLVASQPVPMSPIDFALHGGQSDESPSALPSDPEFPVGRLEMPTRMNLSLRERLEMLKQSSRSASAERFAEQIEWSLNARELEFEMRTGLVDDRRLSQMSGSSTFVEVFVVEAPPQRRRTLRHTSKNSSLRTTSSPIPSSKRSSLISNETRHRLVHRNTRILERGNRDSLPLDSTSAGSDAVVSLKGPESLPIIPQRRSSLNRSGVESKRHTFGHFPSAAHGKPSRPTTAPDTATSYFDVPHRQTRAMSSSLESPALSRLQDMLPRNPPLVVPTRSSSLSTPTSREASRTTSITSTNFHRPDPGEVQRINMPIPVVDVITRPSTPSEDDHHAISDVKDLSALRPRSTLATPFSMASVNSSTPGVLEVNEATAVNIYPHNNKSILLVQQTSRRESEVPEVSTVLAENATFTLTHPLKDPIMHVSPQPTSSPLKYPRAPPQPPGFKVIPPTPANRTPVIEVDRQFGQSISGTSSSGRFAKVRRALSARRYSETFVAPLARSLSRRHIISNSHPTVGDYSNNKLSPFWRPRGFWDDLSDKDSDTDNESPFVTSALATRPGGYTSGPSTLTRRFGSLKLAGRFQTDQHRKLRRTLSVENVQNYTMITSVRHPDNVPKPRYQVRFVSLRELYEKRKMRKEENRREKERTRLRRSIGPVVLREGGAYVY